MDKSLGKLPAEIRNHIYELSLLRAEPIHITTTYPRWGRLTQARHNALQRPLALIMTCRQARDEAIRMFYSSNTFRCTSHESDPNTFVDAAFIGIDFVKSLSSIAAASIRTIIVSTNMTILDMPALHRALAALSRLNFHALMPQCVITAELQVQYRKGQVLTVHVELKAGRLSFNRAFWDIDEAVSIDDLDAVNLAAFRDNMETLRSLLEHYEAEDAHRAGVPSSSKVALWRL